MERIFYVDAYAGTDDDEKAAACMRAASKAGEATVVFGKRLYEINRAISVYSGMTIVLDGSVIRQKAETFDNVFRGANIHLDPENSSDPALRIERLSHVRLLGRDSARIEGCGKNRRAYHPVIKEEQDMTGDYWGFLTYQLLFVLTDDLEISGIRLDHARGWTITLDLCSHFWLHDLEIYTEVKNGDGIHLLSGCQDGIIERIRGITSDDVIAVQAGFRLDVFPSGNYLAPFYPSLSLYRERTVRELDCHDIVIREITCGGEMHGIILLPLNGTCIYNILIEDVEDVEPGERYFATVFLYTGIYGDPGTLRDISVKNVRSLADTAFVTNTIVHNLLLSDISAKRENGKILGTFRIK